MAEGLEKKAEGLEKGVRRSEEEILGRLEDDIELSRREASLYLKILKEGAVPAAEQSAELSRLLERGMVILSGDNSRFIPVHPRLAVANHYRTWREKMVKEINERRMRVDRLILELIPIYEATMERRLEEGKGGKK